ncbi:MAG: hypothetical protein MI919_38630 [Holophagales bacterium]|nr:hypothetical protein [Holophagales bacterium]
MPLDRHYADTFYAGNPSERFDLGEGVVLEQFGRWPAGEVELPAVDSHRISIHVQEDGNRAPSRWTLGGRDFHVELQPSLIMAVPAGHSLHASWEATARGTLNLHFSPQAIDEILESCGLPPSAAEIPPGPRGFDPSLLALATGLSRELSHPNLGGQLMRDALKTQMLVHVCRRYSSATFPSSRHSRAREGLRPAALTDVIDYMHAHLDQSIPLETLANLAQVSRFHFSRMCKKSMGHSPTRELQRLRIDRSARRTWRSPCRTQTSKLVQLKLPRKIDADQRARPERRIGRRKR